MNKYGYGTNCPLDTAYGEMFNVRYPELAPGEDIYLIMMHRLSPHLYAEHFLSTARTKA